MEKYFQVNLICPWDWVHVGVVLARRRENWHLGVSEAGFPWSLGFTQDLSM